MIKTTTPITDPCTLLGIAKNQLDLMLTGQAPAEVETPQLGRVTFTAVNIGELQRYVNALQAQCDAQNGIVNTGARKPFSFEAWP
jgi:hypothetical protein